MTDVNMSSWSCFGMNSCKVRGIRKSYVDISTSGSVAVSVPLDLFIFVGFFTMQNLLGVSLDCVKDVALWFLHRVTRVHPLSSTTEGSLWQNLMLVPLLSFSTLDVTFGVENISTLMGSNEPN